MQLNGYIPKLTFDLIQARIQDFCQRGARKNAENQGHSSIELEIYKQYIAELRAKRAYNYMNLWYARESCCKFSSIELDIYKQ